MTELWKANTRLSTSPWESRKKTRDSHIPTAPATGCLTGTKKDSKKTEGRLHKSLDTAGPVVASGSPWPHPVLRSAHECSGTASLSVSGGTALASRVVASQ